MSWFRLRRLRSLAAALLPLVTLGRAARADPTISRAPATDPPADDPTPALFHHPESSRWWLSGQVNVIGQAQPGFHSPYDGPNSFRAGDHGAISIVGTVFGGLELTPTTAIVVTGESAGGGGLSDALGIAGFTNLDVVRNPTLGPTPYVGRAFLEQDLPLGPRLRADRDPLHVLRTRAARRIELRGGKLSTADWFDVNSAGTDSHLQFMNWSVDNNAAYDYAADTRGYTLGASVTYVDPHVSVRFGEMLMPTVANGIDYDFHIQHARGENLELEVREEIGGHPGTVRVLGFWNHAAMGRYEDAIAAVRAGDVRVPDITASRHAGRTKAGAGLGVEQVLAPELRGFGRAGWNDGKTETFAYTEVDNTVEIGADLQGGRWHREGDRVGLAAVSNGLSKDHREYLALGGSGFLLGDGRLTYGREDIIEAYYTMRVHRGIYPAVDAQLVEHPGYNRDRGPVVVASLRLQVLL